MTDSRGRVTTTTRTISVLDYAQPSLTKFTAERCNSAGTAPQMDGTRVRVSVGGSVSPVGTKNTIACVVYYRTSGASAWTQAATITPSSYSVNTTNLLLSQTFNALSSYDLKVRLQDAFYYIEQTVSIGTKQVMMDFYKDGSGVAFGKVAETPGAVEFGWPVKLSEPLGVAQGGTGSTAAASACGNLGAVKKAGDTMTGNLSISGLSVSLRLPAADVQRNDQPHGIRRQLRGRFLVLLVAGLDRQQPPDGGSAQRGRGSQSRQRTGAARRGQRQLLYVSCISHRHGNARAPGQWRDRREQCCFGQEQYRANNASNLNTGTVPMARLPFKVAYGSTSINGNTAVTINYSSAGVHVRAQGRRYLLDNRLQLVGRQRRDQGLQQDHHAGAHHCGRQFFLLPQCGLDRHWNMTEVRHERID